MSKKGYLKVLNIRLTYFSYLAFLSCRIIESVVSIAVAKMQENIMNTLRMDCQMIRPNLKS